MTDECNSELDRKALELVKLEGAISDCAAMARIVHERIADARIVRTDPPCADDDETLFAVLHLCDMVQDLRQRYYGVLEGRPGCHEASVRP